MSHRQPKQLIQKKPDYDNDSFASWLEKTLFTSIELGDLNKLKPAILEVIKAAAHTSTGTDQEAQEELSVVAAVNETYTETRRVLIRAIGMS